MSEVDQLYQAIIMEHSVRPRGWGAPPGPARRADGDNPFCGDRITVWVADKDTRFEAQSCILVRASASMMTQAIRGLSMPEIKDLFARLQRLLRSGAPDPTLGDLGALAGVAAFPARIACAELPWTTLFAITGPPREARGGLR